MYHDLILETAENVFGAKGFDGATMQDIASEAGISVKTLYASFPGKQELYEAINLARGQEMYDVVAAAHETETDPAEKLSVGLRAFVRFFFEHVNWTKIHLQSHLSWAQRPAGRETGALWDKGQAAHCKVLVEGIEEGSFHDEDPEEVAQLIRAMTRVQAIRSIEQGGQDADEVADRLIARVLRMVSIDPNDTAAASESLRPPIRTVPE